MIKNDARKSKLDEHSWEMGKLPARQCSKNIVGKPKLEPINSLLPSMSCVENPGS